MGSLRQVDIEPGIALLRLDRPERRYALDSGLLIELVDALERLSIDDERRVLVFSTTASAALCSGVDITEELDDPGAHENELLEVFQREGAGLPQGPRPD